MKTESSVLESLTGSFLVSTQQMPDPRFEEQVIFICSHNHEGSIGFAINKTNSFFTLEDILGGAGLGIPPIVLPPVHIGGPVELESAFILHTTEYQTENQLLVTPTVAMSREKKVLEDIAANRGPEKYLFLLGYAGWGPGQLEFELMDGGWLTVPGDDSILFDLPNGEKWKAAAMQYGIDISTYGDVIGYA